MQKTILMVEGIVVHLLIHTKMGMYTVIIKQKKHCDKKKLKPIKTFLIIVLYVLFYDKYNFKSVIFIINFNFLLW